MISEGGEPCDCICPKRKEEAVPGGLERKGGLGTYIRHEVDDFLRGLGVVLVVAWLIKHGDDLVDICQLSFVPLLVFGG